MFILNPHSGVPIYRQLVEQVRRMVASGQLSPGTPMPSVRDLAVEHAVNPMTISKAYSLLEIEGTLVRQRGKPMMVGEVKTPTSNQKIKQLEPHLDHVVLAAKQLQLDEADVIKALKSRWKQSDE